MRRDNTKKAWQTQQHKASAVCDSKKCRVAVAGLKAETSYRMYVSAYNGGGEGPRSEEIVIDTAAPRERKMSVVVELNRQRYLTFWQLRAFQLYLFGFHNL